MKSYEFEITYLCILLRHRFVHNEFCRLKILRRALYEWTKALCWCAADQGRKFEKSQKGSGYGLQYAPPGQIQVTMYFYGSAQRRPSKDRANKEFQEAVVLALRTRLTKGRENSLIWFVELEHDFETPIGLTDARLAKGNQTRQEMVVMVLKNDCMVKMRLSSQKTDKAADQLRDQSVSELSAYLATQ